MRWLLLPISCALFACTAESGASQREPPPARLAGEGSQGRYRFELALDPPRPRLNERFAVEVEVIDLESGAPAEAEVRLDATMPQHGHGMQTVPTHTRLGRGSWRSEGLRFHMPGSWTFHVRAEAEGEADTIELRFEQPPR